MSHTQFFTAGGALRPDDPSYVRRPADDELFELALAGEFCYVLTPRQMGKSSLMVSTAYRLEAQGVVTASIDLSQIGVVPANQWYLSLLTELKRRLYLSVDPEAWWQEQAALGHVQRFTNFLRDVILAEINGQVVIFIDEIDTTLQLGFTDDFFAAIRVMYNARASHPEFKRLTFVLLGVATPAELIKDRTRTPFNIGRGIALQEFSQSDAEVLQTGLEAVHPGQGNVILTRIFHWTNGHPYLTQKLCLSAVEIEETNWNKERVDRLAERSFLSEEASKEINLQSVRDGVQTSPNRRRLLMIYRQVYEGKEVADDERSLDKNRLKLLGLVGSEGGVLQIRNEIYCRVFNLDWIKANTPADWTRPIAIVSTVIAFLLLGVLGYLSIGGSPRVTAAQAEALVENFRTATSPDLRVTNLAGLFQIPGYEERARSLFFDELNFGDQVAVFHRANAQALESRFIIAVRGIYTHLADNKAGNRLLQTMAQSLRNVDNVEATNLATEIEQWWMGREYAAQGDFKKALNAYDTAINLNPDNIGTHFDRGLAYAEVKRYEEALADFDAVLDIVSRTPPTPTPSLASSPTASPASRGTPTFGATSTESSIESLSASTLDTTKGSTPTIASVPFISPLFTSPIPTPSPTPTPTGHPTITATISIPPLAAQRFTSLEQIVVKIESSVRNNSFLSNTLSADRSPYPNLMRLRMLPPLVDAGGPYSGNEGEFVSLRGTALDAPEDTLTYAWDVDSDGTFELTGQSVSVVWTQAGAYTVTLQVTDNEGRVSLDWARVNIGSSPLIAEAGGPYVGNEGSPIVLFSSDTDPGGGPLTYSWDLDYDTTFETPGQVVTTVWPDNGIYTVTLRIDDGLGGVDTDDAIVNVYNVPPTADAGGPYTTTVDVPLTLVATATDVPFDTLSYAWDLDDDGAFDDGAGQAVAYVWATTGTYTVTLRVDDGDGGVATDATRVDIMP